MKVSEYAKKVGVSQLTVRRWFHDGEISGAYQMPSGTIVIPDNALISENIETKKNGITVVYARVSNTSRRETDLEYQAERLANYAVSNGWIVDKIIKEVGSGLNNKRRKLDDLLRNNNEIDRIIVEHKDKLTRFGYNYLEILSEKMGFEIIVVNPSVDDKDDLIADFASVITSFCARIYGQRRSKHKSDHLIEQLGFDG